MQNLRLYHVLEVSRVVRCFPQGAVQNRPLHQIVHLVNHISQKVREAAQRQVRLPLVLQPPGHLIHLLEVSIVNLDHKVP